MGDQDSGLVVENEPRIGMLFNSENEAYFFYNYYGGRLGFSVRREYAHWSKKDKSIICSRRFVCSKSGLRKNKKRDIDTIKPRVETRTDCHAGMGIARLDNGQYRCCYFVEEHNHLLHIPATLHMMRSQPIAGGRQNIGYSLQDHKNYLQNKRQRDLAYGEAGSLLMYFEKQTRVNPSFTYSLQLDTEEQITNIFWADPRMRIDYEMFGDVVTFDTTFCTDKEFRPFGIFAGFNHHREVVIFGAALLYDRTAESFKWLFEAFLEAHGQKKPITVFTDQDVAIGKAILEVFPETWHGFCIWHIMQNGIKHLGNLMKDGSSFLRDFKACMFQYDGELEFEEAWKKLKGDYEVSDDSWLDRIYGLKEKWANCYMKKTLTIGMRSTQLSESMNRDLKDYLKSSLDVVQFFKHFERVVADKRDNELKAEFDARNKLPRNLFSKSPIMKQAGEIYTPMIFEEFQEEYSCISACYIKSQQERNEVTEYIVAIVDEVGDFKVLSNPSQHVIECSCRKFETFGILCCHALRILDVLDIKYIPAAYVLRRWTWAAKNMIVEDNQGNQVEEDIHLDCTERYRLLCPKLLKIASQASTSAEGYALVNNAINELCKKLQNLDIIARDLGGTSEHPTMIKAKGLKKKEGCKGGKRLTSWVEKQRNGKKQVCTTISQASQQLLPSEPSNLEQVNPLDGSHEIENHNITSLLLGSFDYSQSMMFSSQASTSVVHHTQSDEGNSASHSFVD